MREKIHNFHVQGFINPHMQEALEEVLDARLQEIINYHGDIFNLRTGKKVMKRKARRGGIIKKRFTVMSPSAMAKAGRLLQSGVRGCETFALTP